MIVCGVKCCLPSFSRITTEPILSLLGKSCPMQATSTSRSPSLSMSTALTWAGAHGADPVFRIHPGRILPDPTHAVGQHIGHQNVRQAILVEIDDLEAADSRRGGGREPYRHLRQEVDLPAVRGFGGAFYGVRFAGALENMFEHLSQGEAGTVRLVKQNGQWDSQHDGEDPETRQHG